MRGSTPAPGPEFARHGGHTSCVAVARTGEPPTLILDAGTGIRRVSAHLRGEPFRGALLLSHLHWDHTQGLPFFRAGDHPEAEVDLFLPAQGDPVEVLSLVMAPPHFPIRPDELHGRWRFAGLEEGTFDIGGFTVTAREVPHKGGRTFGYRVSDGDRALAYIPDHCPVVAGDGGDGLGVVHEAVRALAQGVDLLVHDAQYWRDEYPERASWGHATPDYALRLGEAAGVGHVVLFHHDPDRTDDALEAYARDLQSTVPFSCATETTTFDLDPVRPAGGDVATAAPGT